MKAIKRNSIVTNAVEDISSNISNCMLSDETTSFAIISQRLYNYSSTPQPSKYAIVFDIDNTLLYGKKVNEACKQIYKHAIEYGFLVYILTARPHRFFNETQRDLRKNGMGVYTQLTCRPSDIPSNIVDIAQYKQDCRIMFSKNHHCTNIINIGDQWSDFYAYNNQSEFDSKYNEPNLFYIFRTDEKDLFHLKLPHND